MNKSLEKQMKKLYEVEFISKKYSGERNQAVIITAPTIQSAIVVATSYKNEMVKKFKWADGVWECIRIQYLDNLVN